MTFYPKLVLLLCLTCFALPTTAEGLTQIYAKALNNDPEFRSQQASMNAVLERREQTSAQVYRPVISFSASGDRNYEDIETDSFGGGKNSYTGYSYGLNLTQPVYHYDRHIALKQADANIEKAQLQLDATEQALMIRTAERYFAILEAQDNVLFSNAEQAALERQLEQSRERFDVGLVAITDVQEAQAGYDLSKTRVLQAENQLDDAKEALKEVTGEDPPELARLIPELPLLKPEPENLDAWTKLAKEENLELRASLIDSLIAEQEISRQKAGHHPTVDIVGRRGLTSTGGRFGNTRIDGTRIAVELNIPIYEGGQVNSRTREALHRHTESVENLERVKRSVERSSRDAYRGILSGISQVNAFAQAVISSETAVNATKAGYEVGTRTAVDVVTAEQDYFRAKRDFSQAKYQYLLETLRLKQAAGQLSPDDINRVNQLLEG